MEYLIMLNNSGNHSLEKYFLLPMFEMYLLNTEVFIDRQMCSYVTLILYALRPKFFTVKAFVVKL